ncbi:branched-chain amino acid ABC transporter permease [Nocardioides acrostichi]|uniref:Branched-chain amino acid ABC transporter permease n=1 Tax=Nocardioides acrostichi TaxID=2784339 RepID=A0A930Y6B4_9ACTN|nr:branched-chain amino acid ABC transporter permease [Nocardioides acrostichi]MBF4160792.1 branched-chain amino acid ABC transporter permease [Nocardioides acrostichi]
MMDVVVTGLVTGGLYALIAQGFVLTYITTNTLNFAIGEFMVVGAFLAMFLHGNVGLTGLLAIAVAVLVTGLLGGLTYRVLVLPFSTEGKHDTRWLLTTVGLSFVIVNLTTNAEGANRQPLGFGNVDSIVTVLGERVTGQQLLLAVVAVVVTVLLVVVISRTRLGGDMRAVSEDAETTALMGISPRRIGALSYVVAMMLVGLGGILWAAQTGVSPGLGPPLLIAAFSAGIIGGLTSLWGPLLGGAVYGLVTAAVGTALGSLWGEVSGLLVVIAVLIVRPEGLLGRRVEIKV